MIIRDLEPSEDERYITPLEVRDYFYCPYILYLKRVRGFQEPETEMMVEGKEMYEELKRKSYRQLTLLGKRIEKPDEIYYSLKLYSRRYKIYGVADIVYRVGRFYKVLEVKYSEYKGRIPKDHFYQTATYALIFEDIYKEVVDEIILYYIKNDKLVRRKLLKEHKWYLKNAIKKIWRILDKGEIPDIKPNRRKCNSCFFKKICPKI